MGRCEEVSTQPPKHPQGPLGDFSPAQTPASKLVSALIGFVFLLVIRESNFPPRGKVGKPTKLILPWETLICNDSTKCCVSPQNLFKEARSVSLRGGGGRICQAGWSKRQALTGLPAARPTIFPLKLLDETKNRNSQFLGRDDEVAGFSEFLAILDPVRSRPSTIVLLLLINCGSKTTAGGARVVNV